MIAATPAERVEDRLRFDLCSVEIVGDYRYPRHGRSPTACPVRLVLVAMLLSLEGTRVALYIAPGWFALLGIGYQVAKPERA
jgi:hypothetical protein